MRVDTALLCDWVTVREGLLHILGGGITGIWREEFPAPIGACLALRVLVHPTELDTQHAFRLVLLAEDGEEIAEVTGEFGSGAAPGVKAPTEEVALNLPLQLAAVGLPAPGAYSFELLIDGIHQTSVPFRAGYPHQVPEAPQ